MKQSKDKEWLLRKPAHNVIDSCKPQSTTLMLLTLRKKSEESQETMAWIKMLSTPVLENLRLELEKEDAAKEDASAEAEARAEDKAEAEAEDKAEAEAEAEAEADKADKAETIPKAPDHLQPAKVKEARTLHRCQRFLSPMLPLRSPKSTQPSMLTLTKLARIARRLLRHAPSKSKQLAKLQKQTIKMQMTCAKNLLALKRARRARKTARRARKAARGPRKTARGPRKTARNPPTTTRRAPTNRERERRERERRERETERSPLL